MKYCLDAGRTHFLRSWPQRSGELAIPPGKAARLYFLAKAAPLDLRVSLDGKTLQTGLCQPCSLREIAFRWMEADIPAAVTARRLSWELGSAELAMDLTTGRPVIRLADGPPTAVSPSYDDPELPVARLRNLLPQSLASLRNPDWRDAWTIALWVHQAWAYRNTHHGQFYCPWQADEILQWGKLGHGPDGTPVIAMCVHYAVTFQQCTLALGTPARLLPLAAHLNSDNGHFVAEVWSRSLRKWVLMDAQSGLWFSDPNGFPLCAWEVAQLENPRLQARCGPGAGQPVPENFPWPLACDSEVFRHIGVWRRADYYTHPEEAPSGHGTTAYAETDILWLERGETPPMFPHFLSQKDYFAAPAGHT